MPYQNLIGKAAISGQLNGYKEEFLKAGEPVRDAGTQ